jgi:hypothetical protein
MKLVGGSSQSIGCRPQIYSCGPKSTCCNLRQKTRNNSALGRYSLALRAVQDCNTCDCWGRGVRVLASRLRSEFGFHKYSAAKVGIKRPYAILKGTQPRGDTLCRSPRTPHLWIEALQDGLALLNLSFTAVTPLLCPALFVPPLFTSKPQTSNIVQPSPPYLCLVLVLLNSVAQGHSAPQD